MSALGRPQDMFSDTAIQLQPVLICSMDATVVSSSDGLDLDTPDLALIGCVLYLIGV